MGEIMELIEIAQLVTGVATLLVATVLIWQMIIQKKTLDIAHNDADSNMSLYAMDTRSRTNEWFADKCTPELLDKFDKKLFRDYFEEIHLEYFGRNINSEANRYVGMRDVMVEAWEEASGRKYELA